MKTPDRKLQIEQLDRKLSPLSVLRETRPPTRGWIHAVRTTLHMSLSQLGRRLGITPASVREIEEREQHQTITLAKLIKVAHALDMDLVYGLVPRHGSIQGMIEARALELARDIVARTSHSMMLEAQENSQERLRKAVAERAEAIRREMPRYLWD